MKPLLLMLLLAIPVAAQKYVPTSVKDWEAKSDNNQVKYIVYFTDEIAAKEADSYKGVYPEEIRQFFTKVIPPHKVPDGISMVTVAVNLLDRQAKAGHIDLSKVYIEDVVQWAIDMKFNAHFP